VEVVGNATGDKTLTALTGGQGPDVFLNQWPNIATWGDKGALLDLTKYVTSDTQFDQADIMPAAWKLTTYKDKILGIPWSAESSEIYYNIDLLKQAGFDGPPQTMEDLVAMAAKLTKTDDKGNITQLGFLPDYPWLDNVLWPVAYGVQWIDSKTNKLTFNSPETAASYQWQVDIYKKYGVDKLAKFKSSFGGDAQSPFYIGKLAMMFNGEWTIDGIAKYAPNLKYGIATIPYPKDRSDLKGSMFLSSNVWNISAKSKNPDAAWNLLSYLAGKENMKANAAQGTGSLLSRVSALGSLPDKAPAQLKEVAKLIQSPNVRSFPMLPYVNEYLTAINDQMTLAINQKQSVQDAMKKVMDKIQPLADQNPINK
jgi:multiple sugar transport system substrate-binding protein